MAKWEYLCLTIEYTATRDTRVAGRKVKDVYEADEVLNALGAEGWSSLPLGYTGAASS